MTAMQTVLVTGGAGFIGAHFIHYFFKKYPDITLVNYDKLTYAANPENLAQFEQSPHYIFIEGDICDSERVARTMTDYRIDTVVHFAAESHVDRSIEDGSVFVKTNVLGTNTLLQAFLNLRHPVHRFHHVSTDEVYGALDLADRPFTELHPYQPSSPYSASKASSDLLVKAYHHTYGLPCTLSNCSNNFGLFQHREKLIPKVIECCLNHRAIPLYGSGEQIRDWIHVDDHCAAIDAILHGSGQGEQYNVGGACELSNIELIDAICSIFDELRPDFSPHRNLVRHVEDRQGHDFRYAIDNRKIETELNWQPQVNFKQALRQLVHMKIKQHEKHTV